MKVIYRLIMDTKTLFYIVLSSSLLFSSVEATDSQADTARTSQRSEARAPRDLSPKWVGERWAWKGEEWGKIPAHWSYPKNQNQQWQEGQWVKKSRGRYWRSGHWVDRDVASQEHHQ